MDEPASPGCLLKCRVIGIIEGQQGKKKKACEMTALLLLKKSNHSYTHVRHVNELGKKFCEELDELNVKAR
jgi:inorganic pyrophosphatase